MKEIPKICLIRRGILPKGCLLQRKSSFAHLKYSNNDHGGFKAAAARPHPHLHHQVPSSRLPQLFSIYSPPNKITPASFNIKVVRPSCNSTAAPHAGQLETARGSRKRGSSTAAPTCSGAQLLPCRSCTTHCGPTMVPLPSSCFPCPVPRALTCPLSAPGLLSCLSASHHALIPQ